MLPLIKGHFSIVRTEARLLCLLKANTHIKHNRIHGFFPNSLTPTWLEVIIEELFKHLDRIEKAFHAGAFQIHASIYTYGQIGSK